MFKMFRRRTELSYCYARLPRGWVINESAINWVIARCDYQGALFCRFDDEDARDAFKAAFSEEFGLSASDVSVEQATKKPADWPPLALRLWAERARAESRLV